MNARVKLIIGTWFLSFGTLGRASEIAPVQQRSPQLGYYVDLNLALIDSFGNPFTSEEMIADNRNTMAAPRSLGLAEFRLGFNLELSGESRLHVVFRPDTLNREANDRDFDSRTGDVYFQRPRPRFLDEYQLSFIYAPNLELSLGVFRALTDVNFGYRPPLDFGLEVRFPERFSGGRLLWRQTPPTVDLASAGSGRGWQGGLVVFQGNDDASEVQSKESKTQDSAPSAKDSHMGAAGLIAYNFSDQHTFGLMLGMGKSKYQELEASGRELKGKKDEVFGQLYDTVFFNWPIFATKLGLDYRLVKEMWKGPDIRIESRTHQSLRFNINTQIAPSWLAFTSFAYGKSKLSDAVVADGYQLDGGLSYSPKQHLYLSLAAAEEHREHEVAGRRIGAYKVDDEERSVIRRVALEVRYFFDRG